MNEAELMAIEDAVKASPDTVLAVIDKVRRLQERVATLEDGIRDEVIEPFDDGQGVQSSNYRRLKALLDASRHQEDDRE